jgi:tRNA (guanine-N7-)-methyltransferase
MAERFPDCNFLGIERQPARVARCLAKIHRLGQTNAHAVVGEGTDILRMILPDASVAVLHVSFPDPWPKRRHASRRLVDEAFLREAHRVLRPDGALRLMTDDAPYFESMCRLTAAGWAEIPWDDGRESVRTSFEKRFHDLGQVLFRRALRAISGPRC